MTIRIVHKNSEAEDKRPTAGQLAKGEIAVNLNAAGAFLTVKDTAGNVQQVGGVKVSATSPSDPILGSLWVDSSNNRLYVYDGTSWLLVTGAGGGGGGGGGVVDEVVAGDGLTGGGSSAIVTLDVGAGNGIAVAADTVSVTASSDGGIAVDSTGVSVVAGDGITVNSQGVEVDLEGTANRVGLELTATDGSGKLQSKIATSTVLGSVKVGATLTVDADGEINGGIASPLKYRGNLNITGTGTSSEPDPATSTAGDSYTSSASGDITSTGTDWNDLLKDPHNTTTTVGDLIICNTDGGGSNGWTLVPVGGTNFWSVSGDDLLPTDTDHIIRAATLADGQETTTGTDLILSDDDGRLVRSTPGTNLSITSGVLNATDTNTTYAISAEDASGVKLRLTGSNPTSTDDVEFAAGTGISIARTDDSTITITNSSPGGTGSSYWDRATDNSNPRIYPANIGDNVGIGTNNPTSSLQVGQSPNSIRMNGANLFFDRDAAYIDHLGDTSISFRDQDDFVFFRNTYNSGDTRLSLAAVDYFDITVNSATRLRIIDNGNVGIGVNTPEALLDVKKGSNATELYPSDRNNYAGAIVNCNDAQGQHGLLVGNRWSADTSKVLDVGSIFAPGGGPQLFRSFLTVLGSGNVGVGTNNPTARLDVAATTGDVISASTTSNACKFEMADGNTTGDIYLQTMGNDLRAVVNGGERVRLRSNGNVGINTNSPVSSLHVHGDVSVKSNGYIASNLYFSSGWKYIVANTPATMLKLQDNSTGGLLLATGDGVGGTAGGAVNLINRVVVKADTGNVGLGVNGPAAQLHLQRNNGGGEGSTLLLTNSSTDANTSVGLYLSPNDANGTDRAASIISTNTTAGGTRADLQFTTANGATPEERLRITGAGNVGVNTTDPQVKLDVAGAIRAKNVTAIANNTAFDIRSSNVYTAGAVQINNPGGTSSAIGMSGLIVLSADPTWQNHWKHAGGSWTAPASFPAVVPFYVQAASVIYVGTPTGGIA